MLRLILNEIILEHGQHDHGLLKVFQALGGLHHVGMVGEDGVVVCPRQSPLANAGVGACSARYMNRYRLNYKCSLSNICSWT